MIDVQQKNEVESLPETESAIKKINYYVQKLEKLVSVLLENNKFGL